MTEIDWNKIIKDKISGAEVSPDTDLLDGILSRTSRRRAVILWTSVAVPLVAAAASLAIVLAPGRTSVRPDPQAQPGLQGTDIALIADAGQKAGTGTTAAATAGTGTQAAAGGRQPADADRQSGTETVAVATYQPVSDVQRQDKSDQLETASEQPSISEQPTTAEQPTIIEHPAAPEKLTEADVQLAEVQNNEVRQTETRQTEVQNNEVQQTELQQTEVQNAGAHETEVQKTEVIRTPQTKQAVQTKPAAQAKPGTGNKPVRFVKKSGMEVHTYIAGLNANPRFMGKLYAAENSFADASLGSATSAPEQGFVKTTTDPKERPVSQYSPEDISNYNFSKDSENDNWTLPVKAEIGLSIPVYDRLFLETGLVYSNLQAKGMAKDNKITRVNMIGIPVGASYAFVDKDRFRVSAGAQFKAEKTLGVPSDRKIQLSTGISASAAYRIAGPVYLYLAPEMSYYFKNTLPAVSTDGYFTYYSAHPLSFTVRMGVSVDLGR